VIFSPTSGAAGDYANCRHSSSSGP